MIAQVVDAFQEEFVEETAEGNSPVEPMPAPNTSREAYSELESLETSLVKAKMQLKEARRSRLGFLIAGIVFLAVNGMLVFVASVALWWTLCIGFNFFGFCFLFAALGTQKDVINAEMAWEVANAKKRAQTNWNVMQYGSKQTAAPAYYDKLAGININNLAEYYAIVKVHTDSSFQITAVAGVIGFLFIAGGLIIGLANKGEMQTLTYISTAAGVITEFISGIFFYLYNRTVRQLKCYHDSLLEVQNILLAFKIVDDTNDPTQKIVMAEKMIEFLMNDHHHSTLDEPAVAGKRMVATPAAGSQSQATPQGNGVIATP